jgi:adenylosuccinate lyase
LEKKETIERKGVDAMKDLDLVGKLRDDERTEARLALRNVSPEDAKYRGATRKLAPYLSNEAEWRGFAYVQQVLLETRMEFGQAEQWHVDEVTAALERIDPLNMDLLESDRTIQHDQIAVILEIGRFVSPETAALLHPGTTSYDIVDTIRAYLYKKAWKEVIRPAVAKSILSLCDLAQRSEHILQVGRTHLQDTSPVPFGLTLAGYAGRLAERVERCDAAFANLKGKVSGIVGTGAGIEMVIGVGRSLEFEKAALAKLGLEPDYTATQIVQKEALSDVGNGLTTLMHVLGDFANDTRMLYSSAIREVTSRDNAERLGGSSTDAGKDNPIQYENMDGKVAVVESGMKILYAMIASDFQRDLRNSVMARYQPRLQMVQVFEAFSRLNKALPKLSLNEDRIAQNLIPVRKNPTEAMVTILRGQGWVHPTYGAGHDFVKEMAKEAKRTGRPLLEVAHHDFDFEHLFQSLPDREQDILNGRLEEYVGSSPERTAINLEYARGVASR